MSLNTYSVNQLDSSYYSLLSSIMTQERAPVTRLTTQKDSVTLQKAVFSDLKTKMDSLQSAIQALRQSSSLYGLDAGRKASVTPQSGYSVLTATAGSGAMAGNYNIAVTTLARAERARSDPQANTDQALGISGTFIMGGAKTRLATGSVVNGTATGFDEAAITSGQQELGSDDYFVEVRNDTTNGWQFRLVDGEGKAVSIKDGSSYDSNWQNITQNSTYDSGRGLTINFGATASFASRNWQNGAAKVGYTAQGAQITLDGTESLNDIAEAINSAAYGSGNEVTASVIDRRMVLQTKETGSNRHLSAQDTSGNTVLEQLGVLTASVWDVDGNLTSGGELKNYTPATDSSRSALLTVNTDISVTRRSNTGLTDVISGLTLNLASDAEGHTALLGVTSDMAAAKTAVSTFVSKFNELQTYLKSKIATTKNADGTYTRGSLAGDMMYRGLSSNLFAKFSADADNDGTYSNLRDIGLDMNTDMQAVISDSSKLQNVLETDLDNVASLFESAMDKMEDEVAIYTGSKGAIQASMDNVDNTIKNYNDRISSMNTRLDARQQYLIKQFLDAQAALSLIQTEMSTVNAGNTAFTNFNYSA
jgi:flagellar hook-associated protein 2